MKLQIGDLVCDGEILGMIIGPAINHTSARFITFPVEWTNGINERLASDFVKEYRKLYLDKYGPVV